MRKELKRVVLSMLAVFALVLVVNVQAKASDTAYEKSEFGLVDVYGNSYTFGVNRETFPFDAGFGAILEVQKASGAKVTQKYFDYYGEATATLPTSTAFRYRVIPYYEDVAGDWSSYRYFAKTPTIRMKTKSTRKGIYVTVKKVKNVSKYKVYVKTKSGYKLSKTIKIGSKKSYTSRVTKYVKSRKVNYLKIVPMVKDSKGTHKSELYQTGSIRTLR